MKCKDARAAISARFDGEDIGIDPAVLEAHLAGCPECRAESEAIGLTGDLLRSVAIPEPSPRFDGAVLGELSQKNWLDIVFEWFAVPVRRVAAAAAFSIIIFGGMLALAQGLPPRPDPMSLIEMQAARAGVKLPDMEEEHALPVRRSERSTLKCV